MFPVGPPFGAWGMDRADAWVLMDAWIRKVINMTFADELAVDDGSGNMVLKESNQVLFNVLLHGLAGSESVSLTIMTGFKMLIPARRKPLMPSS